MDNRTEILREISRKESEISRLDAKFWNDATQTDEMVKAKEELFKLECEVNMLRVRLYNLA